MITVIDMIREVFEDDLGPELIINIPQITPDRLFHFKERYAELCETFLLPLKPKNHLRPYISEVGVHYAKQTSGLNVGYLDFLGEFDFSLTPAQQEDVIKQHLLYSHSLALRDPLPFILDHFYYSFASDFGRQGFANYLTFISHVQPLIEAGVIFFIDTSPLHALHERNMRAKGLSKGRSCDWPPSLIQDKADLAGTIDLSCFGQGFKGSISAIDDALEHIGESLVASQFHERNLDIYFPIRFFRDTFAAVVSRLHVDLHIPEHELRLLNQILSVKIPNLADLSTKDIINIRQNEEAFAKWRNALERALERVSNLEPDLLDPNREAIDLIQKEFMEEKDAIQQDIKKSALLRKAQTGVRSFTVGSVAALGLSYMFGAGFVEPVSGVSVAAAEAIFDLLLSYLVPGGEAQRAISNEASLHHFLLFEPPQKE